MTADHVGIGWRFPLTVSPRGGIDMAGGVEKIEQAIRLILTTYPGERPMRPEFGSLLRDHVFGLTTENALADLSSDVRRAVERWEPRIDVQSVDAYLDDEHDGRVYLDISYVVTATNDVRNLVFPFYRLPADEEV